MKLPTSLTTVTSLSKVFAAILFIVFPFLGFFIGIRFQSNLDDANSYQYSKAVAVAVPTATPMPTVIPTPTPATSSTKTYTNPTYKYSVQYPSNLAVAHLGFMTGADKDPITFFGTQAQADSINNLIGGVDGSIKMAYMSINVSDNTSSDTSTTCKASQDSTVSSSCKVVTVGGVKGTEYTIKQVKEIEGIPVVDVGEQYRTTEFVKSGKLYTFDVFDKNNDYTAANQIINSFKFN